MVAYQLDNFVFRASSECLSVHVCGSWDSYKVLLPLSQVTEESTTWTGCFTFDNATLQSEQRYWYCYVINGKGYSYNPDKAHTVDTTTGYKLNYIDISSAKISSTSFSRNAECISTTSVAEGRSLNPERIVAPKPRFPKEIINTQFCTFLKYLNHSFENDFSDS
jgi:hypothetical protein